MNRNCRLGFLLLLVCQAMHSVEEYATHLYEVFAPARFVSGLVSPDLSLGFIAVNAALIAAGVWTYAVPIRKGYRSAWVLAWLWVIIELANGAVHIALAFSAGRYFPGVLTAPLLVASAAGLAVVLRKASSRRHLADHMGC
jgi:hypothetical protein